MSVSARPVAGLVALLVIVGACSSGATSRSSAGADSATSEPLTVYAAASLKGALDELRPAWERLHPGSSLTISTDSSAALETQIEQGAPADVFLSADTSNPKKLIDKRLADGDAVSFAGNVLTIVVPASNPAGITAPADLAKPGVKIIAAGDDVPITTYADEAVAKIAKSAAGFDAAYAANVVSREDNVKGVIAKIELGEGDAGIVYATDARASTKVTTVALPAEVNVTATYAGVVVTASPHRAAAHALLEWVAGSEGQAILSTFGFVPPD